MDVGLDAAPDSEIWRYACAGQFIVITKDEDFFQLATKPGAEARLVWVRMGNCRTPALLSAMEKLWPRIESCLEAGERVVELR